MHQRWQEGCPSARRLYGELVSRGYRGSESQVRATVRPWRTKRPSAPRSNRPTTGFHWWVLRPNEHLGESSKQELADFLEANPALVKGYYLKESFQRILAEHDGGAVDAWLQAATESELKPFEAISQELSSGLCGAQVGLEPALEHRPVRRSDLPGQTDQAPGIWASQAGSVAAAGFAPIHCVAGESRPCLPACSPTLRSPKRRKTQNVPTEPVQNVATTPAQWQQNVSTKWKQNVATLYRENNRENIKTEKTDREVQETWEKTVEQVKKALPMGDTVDRLVGTALVEVTETAAVIFVPNRFAIPWLERRLYGQIATAIKGIVGKDVEL